jgi:PilZ domain
MRSPRTNQRDFYRIDCRVVISHCVVGDRVPAGRQPETFFPDSEHFNLLRELRRMDQDAAPLLHALGEDDRNLGAYLTHLNRKLDVLARHLAAMTPEMSRGSEQTVSLSEGGLSFHAPQPPAPGSVLALRLTLLPAYVGISVYGTVVAADAAAREGRNVSVHFERLQDADRQIIARHVMQVQMAEQRRNRESS